MMQLDSNRIPGVVFTLAFAVLMAGGCGSRRTGGNTGDTDPYIGMPCFSDTECGTLSCTGGFCDIAGTGGNSGTGGSGGSSGTGGTTGTGGASGTACTSNVECGANEYCQYPTLDPWVPNSPGTCQGPCTSDGQCPGGQTCNTANGQCYVGSACTPGAPDDCPPGHVCNTDHVCAAPPERCYFPEQCPIGWVCNAAGECVDPNEPIGPSCTSDGQCNSVQGCGGGICRCTGGGCVPRDCSGDATICPSGSFCSSAGVCQVAPSCTTNGQDDCTPYQLVCDNGSCRNPTPCPTGSECTSGGESCNTDLDPPGCWPDSTGICTIDDQCEEGTYCDPFFGNCQPGCRTHADCPAGQSCDGTNQCNTSPTLSGMGDVCTSNTACSEGLKCVFAETLTLEQQLECSIPLPGLPAYCERRCHVVCDAAASVIPGYDVCPAPQVCGGSTENALLTAIIRMLICGGPCDNNNGSVCRCPTGTVPTCQ